MRTLRLLLAVLTVAVAGNAPAAFGSAYDDIPRANGYSARSAWKNAGYVVAGSVCSVIGGSFLFIGGSPFIALGGLYVVAGGALISDGTGLTEKAVNWFMAKSDEKPKKRKAKKDNEPQRLVTDEDLEISRRISRDLDAAERQRRREEQEEAKRRKKEARRKIKLGGRTPKTEWNPLVKSARAEELDAEREERGVSSMPDPDDDSYVWCEDVCDGRPVMPRDTKHTIYFVCQRCGHVVRRQARKAKHMEKVWTRKGIPCEWHGDAFRIQQAQSVDGDADADKGE